MYFFSIDIEVAMISISSEVPKCLALQIKLFRFKKNLYDLYV